MYDNVPIFTGEAAPAEVQAVTMQPAAAPVSGLLATDQARAVAEVQAALVIAASRPRNELQARDKLLKACQRIGLANSALYAYKRGGTQVTGPSIRLAETAARCWGNMTYGFRELSRRAGESECEAYAWDLESNTKAVRQFSVRHRRDTKGGGYDLKDERDIYELLANQAQRRVRAAILEIVPGDIIEDAVTECSRTVAARVGNMAEAIKGLLEAFQQMGVSREQIEQRLGHRLDAIQPAQILQFRKIYTSMKDGMSSAADWFEPVSAKPAAAEEKPAAEDKKPAQRRKKEAPAPQPEPEEKKPRQKSIAPIPATGPVVEIEDQKDWKVACPREPGCLMMVSECDRCRERQGCQVWADVDNQ